MTSEAIVAGAKVAFGSDGLVPVIAQDESSGEVLMLAFADADALRLTLQSGRAHYFSRSRQALWLKGGSSGNVQHVSEVAVDCDGDALIYFVSQVGVACHTGERSCFYRRASVDLGVDQGAAHGVDQGVDQGSGETVTGAEAGDTAPQPAPPGAELQQVLGRSLALLERVVDDRLRRLPEGSYVASLHERGLGYMAQKVVEEAGETVVAALERRDDQLIEESADLLFHLAVLLRERGQSLATVAALLEARHRERGAPPA